MGPPPPWSCGIQHSQALIIFEVENCQRNTGTLNGIPEQMDVKECKMKFYSTSAVTQAVLRACMHVMCCITMYIVSFLLVFF